MLDPAIQQFLDERKEAWLKKKVKGSTTEEELVVLESEATTTFSLAKWLPDAAKRAKQLSLVSHPGKFSHPSAKISPVIATAPRVADGFLRTGNVSTGLDVFGNAAAMDVYKFLSIALKDEKTILDHLEAQTDYIGKQFELPDVTFAELSNGLLAIKQSDDESIKTSGKLKQVYFPIDDDYHLLSILTPSNIMYKLKERINIMRFSDEAKAAREDRKKNKHSELTLSDVFNLSVIGFGGTKPQNISVLNSQNGGAAYLLPSLPPKLEKRKIRQPKVSFFKEVLWPKGYTEEFQAIHKLLISDDNNVHLRRKRDSLVKSVIYQIVDQVWITRRLDSGWSDTELSASLPQFQKVWLDNKYLVEREDEAVFEKVKEEVALWISKSYVSVIGKGKEVGIGDDQHTYFKSIVEECKEALL
jgi:CRISPR-associated protein Csy1